MSSPSALPTPSSSFPHLPPHVVTPQLLSSNIHHLHTLLSTYLPPCNLALYRLPPHLTLSLLHLLPSLNITPIFLNSRWTPAEAAQAAISASAHALLLPSPSRFPFSSPLHADFSVPVLHLHSNPLSLTPPLEPISATPHSQNPPSVIFFTSGTTARPKPVRLSISALTLQARVKLPVIPYNDDSIYLHLTPHFHVGGYVSALALSLAQAVHIFPPSQCTPTTHASYLLHLIEMHHVNTLVVVPAVLQMLVDAAVGRSFACVTSILYGAGKVMAPLRQCVRCVFPAARLVGAYGMTETATSITFVDHSALSEDDRLHDSVGWPPAHVEILIDCGSGEGEACASGRKVGEILTRGKHVMEGYVVGHEGIGKEGWFRTGDLGYVDEKSGALFLVGRSKDMIKTGGENVFAGEIEELLLTCEGVRDAAVVGVPHRVLGEAVAAAVVLENGNGGCGEESMVLKGVERVCWERLSGFKRPRWILVEGELPRNSSGKVVKTMVKEKVMWQIGAHLARM